MALNVAETVLVEYETRRANQSSVRMTEAASPSAMVREIVRVVRWFGTPQNAESIGPGHGIYSNDAYRLNVGTYMLRAVVHTATGQPAVQLVPVGSAVVDPSDSALFVQLMGRLVRGKVLTSWESHDCFSVAVTVEVHPSLIRATRNYRSVACSGVRVRGSDRCPSMCGDCPYRSERMDLFSVPAGWHV